MEQRRTEKDSLNPKGGGRKMCRGGERRFLYLSVVGEGVGYIDKLKINSTFLKIKSFRGG